MRRRTLHQLGINLISNLKIRLPVGFGNETRFDSRLSFDSLMPLLSLRDCADGNIWVSRYVRRKSDDTFLCVMTRGGVDSVRKRDKGASLQRFLCCVPGIVEKGPHSRVEIVLHSCFNRMRPGVLHRNAFLSPIFMVQHPGYDDEKGPIVAFSDNAQ